MIIGIGIDLVEIDRVRALLTRHPTRGPERLFTRREVEHCQFGGDRVESYAARFAAKEAVFKALGTGWSGGVTWREVEVLTGPGGAPALHLHGTTRRLADKRGVTRIHVSLTHTGGMAGAYVVLEGEVPDHHHHEP